MFASKDIWQRRTFLKSTLESFTQESPSHEQSSLRAELSREQILQLYVSPGWDRAPGNLTWEPAHLDLECGGAS